MHKNVECNLAADVRACEVFISRSVRVQQTSSFIRDASLDKQPFRSEGCLRAFLLTERVPRPKVGCTLGLLHGCLDPRVSFAESWRAEHSVGPSDEVGVERVARPVQRLVAASFSSKGRDGPEVVLRIAHLHRMRRVVSIFHRA